MEDLHPVCPYDGSWMLVEEKTFPTLALSDVNRIFAVVAKCQHPSCDCNVYVDLVGPATPDALRNKTWETLREKFRAASDPQTIRSVNDARRTREGS